MKLLQDYFALQQQIYDYFGYREDWRIFPLVDDTHMYWYEGDDKVIFSEKPLTKELLEAGQHYENEIYTYCHLQQYVYRGQEFTLVLADTYTDGNIILQVFDNAKEVKELPEWEEF